MKKSIILTLFIAVSITLPAQNPTLDEMIGQMIMIGLNDFTNENNRQNILKLIEEGKVGGVVLFEKDLVKQDTRRELVSMIMALQKQARIPLFVSIDEEGGRVNRLKSKYGFPKSVSAEYLGTVDDKDTTLFYGRLTAQNLYDHGININFAPNVDVNINPENPVISSKERSYSEDYNSVVFHARNFIQAHKAYGITTVIKHFPGHGSSTADSHYGVADVSDTWVIEELYPYKQLIESGDAQAVMTAHIVNRSLDSRKLPATLSDKIISGVLRGMLGFDGVVFSDDMHMAAISKQYGFEDAVELGVKAGVDVLIFSNNVLEDEKTNGDAIHAVIKEKVESGEIRRENIEESYYRIMELKKSMGLTSPDYKESLSVRLNRIN